MPVCYRESERIKVKEMSHLPHQPAGWQVACLTQH